MANKFSELRARKTLQAQERSAAQAERMLAAMQHNAMRQARGLSQQMLADVLHVQQPAIAKLENGPVCTCPPCAATSKPWAVDSK
ncbi:helix-turn-helix transcriptional regulator [Rhodoferax antarcticus]|uniref:helix-turn-helix domain-containing protein n=1 Tax=Rhodoferax antarcticus TaxID=81479 RepID=UPI0026C7B737